MDFSIKVVAVDSSTTIHRWRSTTSRGSPAINGGAAGGGTVVGHQGTLDKMKQQCFSTKQVDISRVSGVICRETTLN